MYNKEIIDNLFEMLNVSPSLRENFNAYNKAIDAEKANGLSEEEAIELVGRYWVFPDKETVKAEMEGREN